MFNIKINLSRGNYWLYLCGIITIGLIIEVMGWSIFHESIIAPPVFLDFSRGYFYNILKFFIILLNIFNIIFQARRLLDIGLPRYIALISIINIFSSGIIAILSSFPNLICLIMKGKNK
ncbi:MAG: hypothetical protein LBE23_11070 [Vagococcus sp.]|nr:hypothetical protein [Vagococcus sp.]